ncbi:hypothetical protein [Advenella kashmirensis]|uniref:hypothetical protein n=1 Tax=Advenella kashmirensis TaxID=310575 RepID=UPI001494E7D9|nr:hypothetical protein [Advenella kashmirensis]
MVRRLDFNTPGYRFESDPVAANEPVLEGRLRTVQLQPGLSMHGTEVIDLHNMVSRVNIKSGLRVVLALAGIVDVRIGGQRVYLRADDPSHGATAAIISMPDDACLSGSGSGANGNANLLCTSRPNGCKVMAGCTQKTNCPIWTGARQRPGSAPPA